MRYIVLQFVSLGNDPQGGLIRTVAYDEANRITALTHVNSSSVAQAANDHSFSFDNLDRLTSWSQNTAAQSYGYDLSGNRNTSTVGATAYALTIAATSNRLSATTGPVQTTNTFDAAGNILSNGIATFTYSDRGRMSSAKVAANTVKYLYNGYADQIDTVRVITRASDNKMVWRWDQADPFALPVFKYAPRFPEVALWFVATLALHWKRPIMLAAPLKSSDVRSRVEPELKASATDVLAQCGLSLSDGISLFLRQVVAQRGLPFEVEIPNALTIEAIKEARAIRLGRFNSAQELIDDLEKNSSRKAR